MILKKTIISFLYRAKTNLFWHVDRVVCRVKSEYVDIPVLNTDCKILILAPHSDDEWIGCSQIIKDNLDVSICNMNMNGGDSKEMHAIRYQEMKSLADKYNRSFFTVSTNNREYDLLRIVQDYRPGIIFVPFFMDWHEEHIQVMNMLKRVSESVEGFQIGMYPVSLPMLPNFITHFKPLNKTALKDKWDVFLNMYKSQTFIPWKRFLTNERISGACVKQYAAEVYSIMPVEQWVESLDHHLLTDEQKKCVKRNLNKISKVREMMRKFSEEV